jgi:hypothetical protein
VEDPRAARVASGGRLPHPGASVGGEWASACDVAGGRGGCLRRTTRPIEATGSQGSAGVLAARSMAGGELQPLPLAPRELG